MLVFICLLNGLAGDRASSKEEFFFSPRMGIWGYRAILLYMRNISFFAFYFRQHVSLTLPVLTACQASKHNFCKGYKDCEAGPDEAAAQLTHELCERSFSGFWRA